MSALTAELTTTATNSTRRSEQEYLDTCSSFSDVFAREQRADGCATVVERVKEQLSNNEASKVLSRQARWALWRFASSSLPDVRAAFSEFAESTVDQRCTDCTTFFRTPTDPVTTALLVLGTLNGGDREETDETGDAGDTVDEKRTENKERGVEVELEGVATRGDGPHVESFGDEKNELDQSTGGGNDDKEKSEKKEEENEEEEEEEEEEDSTIAHIKEQSVWLYVNSCKLGYPGMSWSKLNSIFGMHPTYLESELESHRRLMLDEGPLPPAWRNYIAIMAASRYNCHYLVFQQRRCFLYNGGDPDWLEGLTKVPAKLANLMNLNALLAHRPWLLSAAESEEDEVSLLLSGSNAFSSAELAHAVVIFATYHAKASFCHAMGTTLEPEDEGYDEVVVVVDDGEEGGEGEDGSEGGEGGGGGKGGVRAEDGTNESSGESESEIKSTETSIVGVKSKSDELDDQEIFSRLKKLSSNEQEGVEEEDGDEEAVAAAEEGNDNEEEEEQDSPNKEIKLEEFRQIDDQETLPDEDEETSTLSSSSSGSITIRGKTRGKMRSLHLITPFEKTLLSCHVYCGDNTLEYRDFDISRDKTIFTQEYSWGEQCFALTDHYLSNTGEKLGNVVVVLFIK